MTTIFSAQLKRKAVLLEQQKQRQQQSSIWRAFVLSIIAGSLLWSLNLPQWQISNRSQVKLTGEQFIAPDIVIAWLNLRLPRLIWTIPPQQISKKLESIPAIAAARVTRQILPTRLTISLQERVPVAVASSGGKVGFLDAEGVWIPSNFYQLNSEFPLPALKVINWQPQYSLYWSDIYGWLNYYSTVKISTIRWEESTNIELQTELGRVYFGSAADRLADKFAVLAQLKNLPNYLNHSEIDYIDLSNPDLHLLQKYSQ